MSRREEIAEIHSVHSRLDFVTGFDQIRPTGAANDAIHAFLGAGRISFRAHSVVAAVVPVVHPFSEQGRLSNESLNDVLNQDAEKFRYRRFSNVVAGFSPR